VDKKKPIYRTSSEALRDTSQIMAVYMHSVERFGYFDGKLEVLPKIVELFSRIDSVTNQLQILSAANIIEIPDITQDYFERNQAPNPNPTTDEIIELWVTNTPDNHETPEPDELFELARQQIGSLSPSNDDQ
jgi:hypothetical protein